MSLLQKIEEKKKAQKREQRNKKIAAVTVAAVGGAIIGGVTGVLVAPKSGKETVEDIKAKTNETVEKAKVDFENTKTNTVSKFNESKTKIKEYLEVRKNNSEEVEIVEEVLLIEESTEEQA